MLLTQIIQIPVLLQQLKNRLQVVQIRKVLLVLIVHQVVELIREFSMKLTLADTHITVHNPEKLITIKKKKLMI